MNINNRLEYIQANWEIFISKINDTDNIMCSKYLFIGDIQKTPGFSGL